MTFNSWLICLELGTQRGNTFPFKLTERTYQWLWGQKEAVNLQSSFCSLAQWVSWWQLTSVAAGVCGHLVYVSCFHQVTPPASGSFMSSAAQSSSHGPWPYCPLHSQCWAHTPHYSPQQWTQSHNGLDCMCLCVLVCDSALTARVSFLCSRPV